MTREKPRERPHEQFLLKLVWLVFVVPPKLLAQWAAYGLSRIENKWVRWGVVTVLWLVSAGLFLYVKWLIETGRFRMDFSTLNRGSFFLGCAVYLIILLPVFLAWNDSKAKNRNPGGMKRKNRFIWKTSMVRSRLASNENKVYLGHSFETGRPFYLTNSERLMHTEVVGSTGTGKTDSVLLPMLAHDIRGGKGAIIIDGKGDRELYNHIRYIVEATKNEDKFLYFSLSHVEESNSYNPLHRGKATELKDKLIGSMGWSEEFFRKMAEKASLALLNVLCETADKRRQKWILENKSNPAFSLMKPPGNEITFGDLHKYLTDLTALKELADSSRSNPVFHNDLVKMINQFRDNDKFLSALIADLFLFSRSEFSKRVEVKDPGIDLLDVYRGNKIVYFQLDLQGYADTAKRIGRIILQDVKNLSSHIQSKVPDGRRKFFPVYVDDASSFLDVNFIDFLNKARASQLAITVLHQSMGDLVFHRDWSTQMQFVENTNVKIILRQDDPQSVEKFAKIAGTKTTLINTYQTEKGFEGMDHTGLGSVREGQEFRIDPDRIRQLKRGEAVVVVKNPDFKTNYLKLDYFGHNVAIKTSKQTKETEKKEQSETPVEPKDDYVPEPGDGDMMDVKDILLKLPKQN